MARIIYDPEKDKGAYNSTIYTNDNLMIGCDYEYLLDMSKANATYLKGKQKNPNYTYKDALKQDLKEYIDMIVENTWDEFELVQDNLAEILKERYEG